MDVIGSSNQDMQEEDKEEDPIIIEGFLVAQWLKYWTAKSSKTSSNSSLGITFNFGLIPLWKRINPLFLQL